MELITYVCSYYCFDNVNIEWDKGSQAFKLYIYMMELITYVCSYYCFDNVNIEWDKDSQAFKLGLYM